MGLVRFQRSSSTAGLQRMADEDLMALVRDGDARAFEVVYDRHAGPAFSLAYRMCGMRSRAEEVTQEAFLSLWRSGARYDPARGSVRTWVLGIVHHRAIDALRRSTVHDRRQTSDEGLADRLESPDRVDAEVARRQEASLVRGLLDDLPPTQLRVLELAYYGGFSHGEIAEMLDLPLGTVKGRMRLGLEKLRGRLDEAPGALAPGTS